MHCCCRFSIPAVSFTNFCITAFASSQLSSTTNGCPGNCDRNSGFPTITGIDPESSASNKRMVSWLFPLGQRVNTELRTAKKGGKNEINNINTKNQFFTNRNVFPESSLSAKTVMHHFEETRAALLLHRLLESHSCLRALVARIVRCTAEKIAERWTMFRRKMSLGKLWKALVLARTVWNPHNLVSQRRSRHALPHTRMIVVAEDEIKEMIIAQSRAVP